MAEAASMNGAEWLARALAGTGMSHVFFVESVMRRTLLHLGDLGVKPILAHSEKAAAEVMSLPMFPEMTEAHLQTVASALRAVAERR